MSLRVDNVCVEIQNNPVLREISLNIDAGEIVCLVGRNGAGKSTTFRSIMGLNKIKTGVVSLDDYPITDMPTHQIASLGLGYTPEGSDVFSVLTVEDNISLGTWTRKSEIGARERIERAYNIFPQLRRYMHRGGAQLSGGERKMVSIARALALDPKMLLLDEAFEGLSPAIIPTISAALKKIVDRGRGILLAESNFYHVPDFTDRLYIIERGEIVSSGTFSHVTNCPTTMKLIRGHS